MGGTPYADPEPRTQTLVPGGQAKLDTEGVVGRKHADLGLASLHREWLSLLSTFYKSHRYGRYTFRAVPDVFEEKRLFQRFLAKHLGVDLGEDEWFSLRNSASKPARSSEKTSVPPGSWAASDSRPRTAYKDA